MSTYVILYKWTEQGIKKVKDSHARAEPSVKAVAAAGAESWVRGTR